MRIVRRLYGRTLARDFGPLALKTCREEYVLAGQARQKVNQNVGRVRRMFKWGVENELVSPTVLHGLQAVAGLRRGRTEAPENQPVRPVPEEHIEAVLPHVPERISAMIRVQLLTAMRPGELVRLRGDGIDMSGRIWHYVPSSHKTQHFPASPTAIAERAFAKFHLGDGKGAAEDFRAAFADPDVPPETDDALRAVMKRVLAMAEEGRLPVPKAATPAESKHLLADLRRATGAEAPELLRDLRRIRDEDPEAVRAALAEDLEKTRAPHVPDEEQLFALKVLVGIEDTAGVIDLLATGAPAVREAAADRLSLVRKREVVPALAAAMRDPDETVRADLLTCAPHVVTSSGAATARIRRRSVPGKRVLCWLSLLHSVLNTSVRW